MNNSKTKILIVDDKPINLRFLSTLLTEQGYMVQRAISGKLALNAAMASPPDLILLDILMPQMNGYEVCQRLKASEETHDIPIVFLSALTEEADKVKAFGCGGIDYITKPFQSREVLARVTTHLTIRNLNKRLIEQNACLQQEIRDRKLAEDQQRRLEAELRRALDQEKELGELKSRIISTISHEYRTPLTTISTSAEILKLYRHKLDESKQLKHFERIEASVQHMTDLVNDLLFLSRADLEKLEFQSESLNLVSFCRELVSELQVGLKEAYHLTLKSHVQDLLLEGDVKLIRQIITNLLSNAIKYSPQGGNISLQLIGEKNYVIIQVSDQGIGIPPEDQNHLFESFSRARNVGTIAGTGLGLSIVKKCVDLHNGQITVESQLGVGTTFTVRLPRLRNSECLSEC